ncbi:MAG TPA: hypothetical protein VJA21_22095 [Verrucomicrobiae bacterium]
MQAKAHVPLALRAVPEQAKVLASAVLLLFGVPSLSVIAAPQGQAAAAQTSSLSKSASAFKPSPWFNERIAWLNLDTGVRVHINAPEAESAAADKKLLLIYYALPNGNTIEQTIGKTVKPGDDWHFGIQHIGAQTRFLRQLLPERTVVVAYLENSLKSWPAWRKKFGDSAIPTILEAVKGLFPGSDAEIVLSGHSGGGSLIFGYLNTVDRIPLGIVRIAFLDANYAYEASRHEAKLVSWLNAAPQHYLCVLAYDDASALLNGKAFVTPKGGTWGKSHEMQSHLSEHFTFNCQTNGGFERFLAQNGRVQFILKENPDRKILHTVQVERNGFIHSMVCGTPNEHRGYAYFWGGSDVYARWIQSD